MREGVHIREQHTLAGEGLAKGLRHSVLGVFEKQGGEKIQGYA